MTNLQSLKPQKTLVEQVYERILDAICDGALAPGDRVTQDELALRLQVSRQPVGTALGQLKQQGFLVERGRRGLQVAPIDPARFDAIYELRSALEPLAASLAAKRATAAQIDEGRALIAHGRQVVAAGDSRASLLADVAFHEWIYRTCGNALVVQSMQTHWQHLRRSMGEVLRHPELARVVWDEHAAVLDAIARGDAGAAAKAIGDHVTTAHGRVGALLAAPSRDAA
ncbi:MAG: GntR family transcriptional regulator [Betaproteobacteria bacterium]|nr:GntR family transcriptional regulator [Betaproteobacteria bacterium]MCC6247397.1 GntR family transcriptional regulator [Rubrivivax sp.]MCL4695715.1 GntR family transcriptional regulator [Burkholderiaceae bacterium]